MPQKQRETDEQNQQINKVPLTELAKNPLKIAIPLAQTDEDLESQIRKVFEHADQDKTGSLDAIGLRLFYFRLLHTQGPVEMTEQ